MKKIFSVLLGCCLFAGALEAADVHLTQKYDHIYFLEVTEFSGDNNTDVLKAIAKAAKRKGFKVFVLPKKWTSNTTCDVGFTNDTSEEYKMYAMKSNCTAWQVDWVLR